MTYGSDGWILSAGEQGWGLHYGAWDDSNHLDLVGFESAFDAFAFLFAHLSIDVSIIQGHKPVGRWWTFKPKEPITKEIKVKSTSKRRKEIKQKESDKPEQLGMFE